jgi:RimJ/RimL family protein N-acetyltransferase
MYLPNQIKNGFTGEKVGVRPAIRPDFEQITDYFLNASPSFLKGMGVDPSKLPPREKWIDGFLADSEKPDAEKDRIYLIWTFEGRAVGHASVNKISFGKEAFIHLHLWKPELRKAGLGTEFFRRSVEYFSERLDLERMFCEPFAENPAPNKVLPKIGFRFVKKYETIPGQINFKQEVNQYELTIPRFGSQAQDRRWVS